MNCGKYLDLLPLRAIDELTPAEKKMLDAHIEECHDCRAEADRLEELTRTLQLPPGDGMTELEKLKLENVMLRRLTRIRTNKASARVTLSRGLLRVAATVMLVASGFLLATLFNHQTSSPRISNAVIENQMASLTENPRIAAGHRFSAAGLKLIARGRNALEAQNPSAQPSLR